MEPVRVTDLNQVILQIDVHIVEVMGELDQTKVSSQFNKPVLNVMEMVRKSLILVAIAMVKVKSKHPRKYL